ncbi:MAG: DUF3237 family protein [Polyangiaceae bacterium]|nr:DUF3237 family protein [Polyangiaceae bacterium]
MCGCLRHTSVASLALTLLASCQILAGLDQRRARDRSSAAGQPGVAGIESADGESGASGRAKGTGGRSGSAGQASGGRASAPGGGQGGIAGYANEPDTAGTTAGALAGSAEGGAGPAETAGRSGASATGGIDSPGGGAPPATAGSSAGGGSTGGTGIGGVDAGGALPTGGGGPAGGSSATAGSSPGAAAAGGVGAGGDGATGGITGAGGGGTAGSTSGGAATGGVGTGGDSAAAGISGAGGGGNGGSTRGGAATGGTATGGTATGGGGAGGATPEDATIVPDPDWACGMADGIPAPTKGQLAFSITLQVSAIHDVGNTPYGHRRLLDVEGGTITGGELEGSVLTGGLEYELTLSNGVVEFQGLNILKTSDDALIFVRSCGVAPDGSSTPRVIPDFEATTTSSYAFLNTGKYVATRVATAGTLELDVYDVSAVTAGEPRVEIAKPSGVPKQPWDCNTTTGARGAPVFTETLSLGSSMSIPDAKYGSRNIIPITGGTATGEVTGSILAGGADYQLSGSLDSWYTLAPSNGEFILVRNCGPMGQLVPWFEARTDGDYGFLNANTYLSSEPGMAGGGVSITFYERQ